MLSKTYSLSATDNSYRSFVHVHFLGGLIGMLELHEKTRNRVYCVCRFVCVECICRILAEHVKHKTSRIREWGCGKRTYFHLSTCSGEFGTRTFPLRPISFFLMDSAFQRDSSLSFPLSLSLHQNSLQDSQFLRGLLTESSPQQLLRGTPLMRFGDSSASDPIAFDIPMNDSITSVPLICGGSIPQWGLMSVV